MNSKVSLFVYENNYLTKISSESRTSNIRERFAQNTSEILTLSSVNTHTIGHVLNPVFIHLFHVVYFHRAILDASIFDDFYRIEYLHGKMNPPKLVTVYKIYDRWKVGTLQRTTW